MKFVEKIVPRLRQLAASRSIVSSSNKYSSIKGMSASTITSEVSNGHAVFANIFRLETTNLNSLAEKGAQILSTGGVIGVPTDTVYGIAADAQNDDAISKIYKIKGRDFRKPIAICVSSIAEVYDWGKVEVPRELLVDLLPGPVTLVFERQKKLNPHLNPSTNLIGIRIPDNQFIINLAKFHNGPLALTSANFSNCPSTLDITEFSDLWSSLDCVFDGGRLSSCEKSEQAARAGSTVIDLSRPGFYHIIRDGTNQPECVAILQNKYSLKKHTGSETLY